MGSEKEGEKKRKLLSLARSSSSSSSGQIQIRTEVSPHMAENSNNGSSAISRMPQDQLFSILLLLPVESILCLAMTCKKFKSLASSEALWESICRRDWGQPSVDAIKASNNQQVVVLSWNKLYQQVCRLDSVFCHRLLSHGSSHDGGMVPSPRASHSLNLVSGFLVLFGGGFEGGRHLDDTWIARVGDGYPDRTLSWQRTSSGTPSGRFGHSCVVIGDALVLFGGINDLGVRQNDTWVGRIARSETLGTAALTWRLLQVPDSTAPSPRGAHAGCSLGHGRMLVHGGIGPNGLRLGDLWILDLSEDLGSGTWREVPTRRSPPSRSGHTLTYIGRSQTIIFGGRGMGYEVLNDVWLLEESRAGRFRWARLVFEAEDVPQGFSLPRVGHSASLIAGRRLLIYGGEDSNRHRKDDFWVLDIDPRAARPGDLNRGGSYRKLWKRLEPKGDRADRRSFHGACVDESGCRLYVYGGMVDGITQPADSSGLRFNGESFLIELGLQTQA